MIIYKTTNLINGKIYIGKSIHNNASYLGSGKLIKQAIKLYGTHNFTKEILEYCNSAIINDREIYWIKHLNACHAAIGYNLDEGGQGGDLITNNPNKDSIIQNISKSTSCKICIKSIEYSSIISAANLLKVEPSTIRLWLNDINKTDCYKIGVSRQQSGSKIIIDSIEYKSIADASRTLNMQYNDIRTKLNDDNYPTYIRLSTANGTKCIIHNIQYDSLQQAADCTNLAIKHIIQCLDSDAHPEYIRLRKKQIVKRAMINIDNIDFYRAIDACKHCQISKDVLDYRLDSTEYHNYVRLVNKREYSRMSIEIDSVKYRNRLSACEQLSLEYNELSYRLNSIEYPTYLMLFNTVKKQK